MNKHDLDKQMKLFDDPNSELDDLEIFPEHITSPMDPDFDPFDHLDKLEPIKWVKDKKPD